MSRRKIKDVREFDIITHKSIVESGKYKHIEEDQFKRLVKYTKEFQNDSETDVLQFLKLQYNRDLGQVITTNNYVGLIQVDKYFGVQILPKIDLLESDEGNVVDKTKKVFLDMLKSMPDFKYKIFDDASLKTSGMNIYEIFIDLYIQETRRIVKRGLKSNYVAKEANLNTLKGKILINKNINENFAHGERFFVGFDEFNINRVENRLIKSTLLKLRGASDSSNNIREIKKLLPFFEDVDISINYESDFSKINLDRNTKEYKVLIEWSKIFLLDKSFTPFAGTSDATALLFPMEKVFEGYVTKYVKRVFGNDWTVKSQSKSEYLYDEPKKFKLIPDILLKRDNCTIVMDTKWKRLNKGNKNYGISQADMYQMYAYSHKYDANQVWLIYPNTEEMKDIENIEYISHEENHDVCVKVFFVDVANIEESLSELKEKINARRKEK